MKFRTRKGRLEHKLNEELNKNYPSIERIVKIVEEYESDNLKTINKFNKKKKITLKKINGALKQSIHAHGPIEKNLLGSAAKRIYGSLLEAEEEEKNKISLKDVGMGFIFASILFLSFYLFN